MSKGIVIVFFSSFLIAGIAMLCVAGWLTFRSIQCKSWPTVSGVVDQAYTSYVPGKHNGSYAANVAYHYDVAGAHYASKHLAFGEMSGSSQDAQEVVNRYPVSKPATVYYSPTDPQLAVLEPGIHGGMWICFAIGVVFTLVGSFFMQLIVKSFAPGFVPQQANRNLAPGKVPPLMAAIFFAVGVMICFIKPSNGDAPRWVIFAIGSMFACAGLAMFTSGLANKLPSKILGFIIVAGFLAVFHWVSFAPGPRIGTSSTPFATHYGTNVKLPFAIFTVFMDVVLFLLFIRWVRKISKP